MIIKSGQCAERALEAAVEARGGFCLRRQPRADRRRQGQRHDARHDDRKREGERELADKTSLQAAHEIKRDENGHEGERHRHDGEADFARAFECGVERTQSALAMACDILDHHDRVVHDEPDRNRERHQR